MMSQRRGNGKTSVGEREKKNKTKGVKVKANVAYHHSLPSKIINKNKRRQAYSYSIQHKQKTDQYTKNKS
jgi:hypothetical protein